jgi:hypothetical protein
VEQIPARPGARDSVSQKGPAELEVTRRAVEVLKEETSLKGDTLRSK